jgi:glycosyltransferase involved in cell wall biosynthesis
LLKTKWKYGDIKASFLLARIFKTYRIDVALVMQSKDMSIVTIAQAMHPGTKLVFFQEMQSGIDKRDIFHTWMYSKLALWFTLTKKMKEDAVAHTRMPAERIIVNHIGTDMNLFNPALYNPSKTREQFGLSKSGFIVGMLGRLDPQKGQEEFIRAIPNILIHQSDLHFVVAGDETPDQAGYKKFLVDLTGELKITEHIQFLPFTNAVPEFLSAIDLFVMPSHSETFGFVLVEAMAMGKPIVATNAGGVPEIITDGITGLLVPPQNVQALTDALLKMLKNPPLRSSLSEKGRIESNARFDFDHCLDDFVVSLESI